MEKPLHIKPGLYALYYEYLKQIAHHYGYNLLVHGSMARDLDLLCVPWTDSARDPDKMIFEMQEYMTGYKTVKPDCKPEYSDKPHGRKAVTIELNRGDRGGEWVRFKDRQFYIDISIMPLIPTK